MVSNSAAQFFKTRCLVVIAMLAFCALGCGPSRPATAPVSGVVSHNGKPVANAMVTFFPQNVADAMIGRAYTDAEGRFNSVSTFGSGDGAVVGTHKVSVTEGWPPDLKEIPRDASGMEKTPPRGPWAAKYRDSMSGALTADVVAKKANSFEFDLTK